MSKPGGRGPKRSKKQKSTEVQLYSRPGGAENHRWTPLQTTVLELYSRGFARRQVVDYLAAKVMKAGPLTKRRKKATKWLSRLEKEPWFRDKLWELAVVWTDLQAGAIMKGITAEAKRGRVDAAKLALEVTGRYTPKGEPAPSNIQVHFGFLPRPDRQHTTVEGVLLGEEDEDS